ncbi:hypothetical protein QTO34_004626 [Cnephaeus nilssonii]|uniref:G-protein coupled receptors family 1 profile domain-containing protein n=1 Tax=Cnephaeus nilssonii TaxID=3371016 RepID=A0AA40HPN7_CNENI|nr:hypothetical protein QTO34_004626 [Eptesicus nilssonii]
MAWSPRLHQPLRSVRFVRGAAPSRTAHLTLMGNGVILGLICLDSRLHTPMYSFLSNLVIIDMSYASSTVPKMLANLVMQKKTISFAPCILQTFLYLAFAVTECMSLVVMSHDRRDSLFQKLWADFPFLPVTKMGQMTISKPVKVNSVLKPLPGSSQPRIAQDQQQEWPAGKSLEKLSISTMQSPTGSLLCLAHSAPWMAVMKPFPATASEALDSGDHQDEDHFKPGHVFIRYLEAAEQVGNEVRKTELTHPTFPIAGSGVELRKLKLLFAWTWAVCCGDFAPP